MSTPPSWCWDPKETFLPVTQTETFRSIFPPALSPLSGDLIRSPIETNPVHFPYITGWSNLGLSLHPSSKDGVV